VNIKDKLKLLELYYLQKMPSTSVAIYKLVFMMYIFQCGARLGALALHSHQLSDSLFLKHISPYKFVSTTNVDDQYQLYVSLCMNGFSTYVTVSVPCLFIVLDIGSYLLVWMYTLLAEWVRTTFWVQLS